MKQAKLIIAVILLFLMGLCLLGGCEKSDKDKAPAPEQEKQEAAQAKPAEPAQPAAAETVTEKQDNAEKVKIGGRLVPHQDAEADCKVSPEDFWNLMLDRQNHSKKMLEDKLAVYEKHGANTTEAQKEIKQVMLNSNKQMKEVHDKYGITPADLRPCYQNQDVQSYRRNNKELTASMRENAVRLRELNEKMNEYNPRPSGLGPGPGLRGGSQPGAGEGQKTQGE